MSETSSRIEVNPKLHHGKPIIRGTNISVERILRKLSEGQTEADLMEHYPGLAVEDIRAAVEYGSEHLAQIRG